MADDVPAPSAPAETKAETTPDVPASPQGDTPAGAPGVTNSSRQARPLPEETRLEFFTGQATAEDATPSAPPILQVAPPPARPDLDADDLEFKVQLTLVGRSGELACRSVTIPCSGGLARSNAAGAILQARENLTSQTQTLLRLMLDKLRADTSLQPVVPELTMAPGPSAIALSPPPSPDAEGEELVPRT